MNLIEHIEGHIGKISCGSEKDIYDIEIIIIEDKPKIGLKTFITVGLSKYELNYKSLVELVFVCKKNDSNDEIVSFLSWLSKIILSEKKIILRGDVIYLPRNITENSSMNALYASIPFYFDDDFQVFNNINKNIIFPLLIPIYKDEAKLIQKNGWNKFEDFLENNKINNLYDLYRNPLHW